MTTVGHSLMISEQNFLFNRGAASKFWTHRKFNPQVSVIVLLGKKCSG